MAGTRSKKERHPVVVSIVFMAFFSMLNRTFSLEVLHFSY